MQLRGKKIIIAAMLAGISILLGLFDRMLIPFFPWSKIGLANIAVFIGVETLPFFYCVGIVLTKIFFTALFSGVSGPGFIAGVSGSVFSFAVMVILRKFKFSILPVSIWASITHIAGQIAVISVMLNLNFIFLFKTLVFFGIMNGLITGFIVFFMLRRLKIE